MKTLKKNLALVLFIIYTISLFPVISIAESSNLISFGDFELE